MPEDIEFDPSFLPPVPSVREERVFTAKNGQAFTLALEISSGGETALLLAEEAQTILEAFGPESENAIQANGSAPVKVGRTLAFLAARILLSEVAPSQPKSGWRKREFPWWATLAQRDAATWNAVQAFHEELSEKALGESGDPLKND